MLGSLLRVKTPHHLVCKFTYVFFLFRRGLTYRVGGHIYLYEPEIGLCELLACLFLVPDSHELLRSTWWAGLDPS